MGYHKSEYHVSNIHKSCRLIHRAIRGLAGLSRVIRRLSEDYQRVIRVIRVIRTNQSYIYTYIYIYIWPSFSKAFRAHPHVRDRNLAQCRLGQNLDEIIDINVGILTPVRVIIRMNINIHERCQLHRVIRVNTHIYIHRERERER